MAGRSEARGAPHDGSTVSAVQMPDPHETAPRRARIATAGRLGLMLGALGVVFGDIGTSPLYALQTVFSLDGGVVTPTETDVYGVISLVFWAITLIVTVKYVTFILRADNDGEGGIMALTALVAAGARPGVGVAGAARHLRRGALLRRRHHHPGDLGAVGGRGAGGRLAEPGRPGACRSRSPSSSSCSPSSASAPAPWAGSSGR